MIVLFFSYLKCLSALLSLLHLQLQCQRSLGLIFFEDVPNSTNPTLSFRISTDSQISPTLFNMIVCSLVQGSPTHRPWTCTSVRPVRNWVTQQEVSSGQASKVSSVAPHHSPSLTLPPEPYPRSHPGPWKNCLP